MRQNRLRKRCILQGIYPLIFMIFCYGCQSKGYVIEKMEGKYIPVMQTQSPDLKVVQFVDTYKSLLDEQMNEVVGYSEEDMDKGKPESLLTNFTTDVMMTLPGDYMEGFTPDLSFVNTGGLRASIAKGNITVGDLFNTYSFENQLVAVRLEGKFLREVFESYARMGGGGISSSVKMHIKDRELQFAEVNGEPVDDRKVYTIVTLDYLAEGNGGMQGLTKAVSVYDTGVTLRDFMINHVREKSAKGETIKSFLDQRITLESTDTQHEN